jgi:hypothetical protein
MRKMFSQRAQWPVFINMDRLTERPFEQPCGKSLIVVGRGLSAAQTFVFRAFDQGLGRFEGPAAGGTYWTPQGRKIRPAFIAKSGDSRIPDRGAAKRTGCGKNEVEDAGEKVHMRYGLIVKHLFPWRCLKIGNFAVSV